MRFTAQRYRLTKRLRPNHKTTECFSLPDPSPCYFVVFVIHFLADVFAFKNVIEIWLIYSIVLISVVQQSNSVIDS